MVDGRSRGRSMPVELEALPVMGERWAVRIGRMCAGMGMYVLVWDDR